jgi:carboxypeptidase PM20D1
MKGVVVAHFEALSQLHRRGLRPKRTILLALGHDEEVGGGTGATQIAAHLQAQGRRVALVWDEGMVVLSDGLGALMRAPVALVGTAEKVRKFPQLLPACVSSYAEMLWSDACCCLVRCVICSLAQ